MSVDEPVKSVTVASLAQEIEGLKAQVAIMVEWLETHGERLDRLEQRLADEG